MLFGIGFGLVNAPITNTAVSGMPRAQAGVAAAVASTSRQVGQSLGVAVLGAALAAGLHEGAWWIITGCGAAVLGARGPDHRPAGPRHGGTYGGGADGARRPRKRWR